MNKRAIVLLLDSFGVGAADDAEEYHDEGSNTFGHLNRPLYIPNLARLGLFKVAYCAVKKIPIPKEYKNIPIVSKYGYAQEISRGKDTPSGHWEIAGVPVLFDLGYFPEEPPFPESLIQDLIKAGNIPGILGNCHDSGTEIIARLGAEHLATKKPIVYTSADSVFQIAAHEDAFGLNKLYNLCEVARKLVDPYHIGRVIARPFLGTVGNFVRTSNRRDYTMPPPAETLLQKLQKNNVDVIAIGKTADIFSHTGINETILGKNSMELFDATLSVLKKNSKQSLIFTNFTDFDTLYGHRRDVAGYTQALEAFDQRLPEFERLMQPEDVAIITADHGCDPTFRGTDHTREYIPILMFGPKITPGFIGKRKTFADIGQTLAKYFGIAPLEYGKAF